MKGIRTIRWAALVGIPLLAIMLLMGAAAVYAQGPGGRGAGRGGPGGVGAAGLNLGGLDLTDQQREQIREIVQRYQEQMRTEIMSVLTPEQQAKAKQMQDARRERLQEGRDRRQQRQQ